MILSHSYFSKNERFGIFVAFFIVFLVFWTSVFPNHREVKRVAVPLVDLENFLTNQTSRIGTSKVIWITSGQDVENSIIYQRFTNDTKVQILFKNKLSKNLQRVDNVAQVFNLVGFDMTTTVCDLNPSDYYLQKFGEQGYPVWWSRLLHPDDSEFSDEHLECPTPFSVLSFGRITAEYDIFPQNLVSRCNRMDGIWVPSTRTSKSLQIAGVKCDIKVVPVYTDTAFWDPSMFIEPNGTDTTFRFVVNFMGLAITNVVIEAYLDEFSDKDDVELLIFSDVASKIHELIKKRKDNQHLNVLQEEPLKEPPKITYINLDSNMDSRKIAQFYKQCHCFLYSSEFQGNPGEAMSMEIPVLTNVPNDIMNEENSIIVYKNEKVDNFNETKDVEERKTQEGFKRAMRSVLEHNPEILRKKGKKAREDLIESLKNNAELIDSIIKNSFYKKVKTEI